jgi:hypothetical protein
MEQEGLKPDLPRFPLSERGPPSSHGGEWLWSAVAPVGAIVPRTPGLIWVHGLLAGDVMVDGSIRGERLRPLCLRWTTARERVSGKLGEPAGRVRAIWELVGLAKRIGTVVGSADRVECPRAEFTQRVKAAPGEFAGKRQRRSWMREPALLEGQVVGAVGTCGTAGRLR